MATNGAFVIQFQPETVVDIRRCAGRVEHIATSRSMHFNSLVELLAFITRVLSDARADRKE
jgi:hypothetical protein